MFWNSTLLEGSSGVTVKNTRWSEWRHLYLIEGIWKFEHCIWYWSKVKLRHESLQMHTDKRKSNKQNVIYSSICPYNSMPVAWQKNCIPFFPLYKHYPTLSTFKWNIPFKEDYLFVTGTLLDNEGCPFMRGLSMNRTLSNGLTLSKDPVEMGTALKKVNKNMASTNHRYSLWSIIFLVPFCSHTNALGYTKQQNCTP